MQPDDTDDDTNDDADNPDGSRSTKAHNGVSYEYLLSMSLSSLTLEKVHALQQEAAQHEARVEELKRTTEKSMWRADLDAFVEYVGGCVGGRGWV